MDSKELLNWIRDMRADILGVAERIENDTLSDKDFKSFKNMILELDHEVRNSPDYHSDNGISYPAVSVILNETYGALNARNTTLLRLDEDMLQQTLVYGEVLITKEDREAMEKYKPREDGRTYIDFLPRMPHEQYLQVVENLKSLGAKFDRDLKQWYVEADWKLPEASQEAIENISAEQDNIPKEEKKEEKEIEVMDEKKFKAVYYDGNSERKKLFSGTKEGVIQAVREAKPEVKENERCYIQERDTEAGKYQQEGIYLISSGKDVTPVEIRLPYISSKETFDSVRQEIKTLGARFSGEKKVWYAERSIGEDKIDQIRDCLAQHDEGIYLTLPETNTAEQFKTLVEQLKQDGARYNPDKKAWYITEKNDCNKFSDYLPSGKASIHEKLSQNKESIGKKNQENGKSVEPRNKDVPERA